MLVLTRKPGQRVEIGIEGIVVEFVRMHNGAAVLSFIVPDHITVHRAEVANAIRRAGRDPYKREDRP